MDAFFCGIFLRICNFFYNFVFLVNLSAKHPLEIRCIC